MESRVGLIAGRVRSSLDLHVDPHGATGERRRAVGGRRDDVRKPPQPIYELEKGPLHDLGRGVARGRERDARRDDAVRRKTEVDFVQLARALNEETRAGDERERERNLRDYEEVTESIARRRRAARSAAHAERWLDASQPAHGRQQPEEHRHRKRRPGQKHGGRRSPAGVVQPGDLRWGQAQKHA